MDAVHVGGLGGTYGGNPISCAAAVAAIETMRELDLNAAARRIESVMLPRLRALAAEHPEIGDVRGRGAMLAIELVEPAGSGGRGGVRPDEAAAGGPAPDAERTKAVASACHAAGLLVLTCGTYGNVLRFLPPLVMDDETLQRGLEILETAFG
jgi:4-aminobutyrate aminotransferase/(S)-3-amino-2-methylpropionate transaminase